MRPKGVLQRPRATLAKNPLGSVSLRQSRSFYDFTHSKCYGRLEIERYKNRQPRAVARTRASGAAKGNPGLTRDPNYTVPGTISDTPVPDLEVVGAVVLPAPPHAETGVWGRRACRIRSPL
jgi:hypothetical protein